MTDIQKTYLYCINTYDFFKGHGSHFLRFTEEKELAQVLLPSTRVIPMPANMGAVYSFDFEVTKQISNCNNIKTTYTACVESFFDTHFGSVYNDLIKKSTNYSISIFGGTDYLQHLTGCQKLCDFINYDFNLVHIVPSKDILDGATAILNETNFSSLLTLIHVPKSAVLQNEEVPYYTFITFLSDVGGIVGIFMGLSLFSLYSMCIAPITRKIDEFLSGEK